MVEQPKIYRVSRPIYSRHFSEVLRTRETKEVEDITEDEESDFIRFLGEKNSEFLECIMTNFWDTFVDTTSRKHFRRTVALDSESGIRLHTVNSADAMHAQISGSRRQHCIILNQSRKQWNMLQKDFPQLWAYFHSKTYYHFEAQRKPIQFESRVPYAKF